MNLSLIAEQLQLSDRERRLLAERDLDSEVEIVIELAASGRQLSSDAADILRQENLHFVLAHYFELSLGPKVRATKVASAAAAWRAAGQPRRALRLAANAEASIQRPHERGMLLTVLAAALVDVRQYSAARAVAEEAVRCNRFFSDHPHRVLMRISRLEGRAREASAHEAQARHIEAFRRENPSLVSSEASSGPAEDAFLFETYVSASETTRQRNQEWYDTYLDSAHWQECRRAALSAANGRCERCGASEALHVHHRTYDRIEHEELQDLEVLCEPCHANEHDETQRAFAIIDSATGRLRD